MSEKKLAVVVTATVMVGKGRNITSVGPDPQGRAQMLDAELAKYVVDNGAGRFPPSALGDEAEGVEGSGA